MLKPDVCCLYIARKVAPAVMLRWVLGGMMLLEKKGIAKDPGPPISHIQARLQPIPMSRNSSYQKVGGVRYAGYI